MSSTTSNTAVVRLKKDYKELIREPLPNIRAAPSPNNLLLWYYIFVGDKGSDFQGGYYFGTIKFPPEYPFKPPSYSIHMDNGRFIVGKDICISNSAYHSESWSPLWSLSGILTGYVAFFHDLQQKSFIGSVQNQNSADYVKYAKESRQRILDSKIMNDLFPNVIEQIKAEEKGAALKHTLPFPDEHYEEKKRTETIAAQTAIEDNKYEVELQYDTYSDGSESEGTEG